LNDSNDARSAVQEMQDDCESLLATSPDLAQIMIRKEGKGTLGEIIAKALDSKVAVAGKKPGAILVVRMPEWKMSDPASPAPIVTITQPITVFENPLFNMKATGTQVPAARLVERVMQRLHHRNLSVGTLVCKGAEPARIEGVLDVGYDVEFTVEPRTLPGEHRAAIPIISFSGGNCTLACTNSGLSGEVIYYTVDGRIPVPGVGLPYGVPFAVASGTRVRAASTASGRELSEASEDIAP